MAEQQHPREGARSREAATVQRCSAAADSGGGGPEGRWGCSDERAPVADAGGVLEEQQGHDDDRNAGRGHRHRREDEALAAARPFDEEQLAPGARLEEDARDGLLLARAEGRDAENAPRAAGEEVGEGRGRVHEPVVAGDRPVGGGGGVSEDVLEAQELGRLLGAADLFQRADGLGELRRVREDHPGEPEGIDRLRVDPVPGDGEGEGHGVVGRLGWW